MNTDHTAKTYRYYVDSDGYGDKSLWAEDPERPERPLALMRELENLRTWPVVEAVFAQSEETIQHVADALIKQHAEAASRGVRSSYRDDAVAALSALRDLAGGA